MTIHEYRLVLSQRRESKRLRDWKRGYVEGRRVVCSMLTHGVRLRVEKP